MPLNFIEAIELVLQENMIRAGRNKVPQFKNEVLQLKVEHESNFSKTINEIQKAKQN